MPEDPSAALSDENKSRQQLIAELTELRTRLAATEQQLSPTATLPNQAGQRVQEAKDRYALALQAAQEGVWDWNLETDEVYYSPRWKAMLGYREEEIEPHIRTWERLLHPEDRARAIAVKEAVVCGEAAYTHEVRLRHKDGNYRTILSHGVPLRRGQNGPIVRLVGTHLDISERRRAEEQVRFQARLLDAVGQAVVALDAEQRIRYWNRAAEALYGWSAEEALGRVASEVIWSADSLEQGRTITGSLRRGEAWSGEFQVRRKDGILFTAWISVTPFLDSQDQPQGFIGVAHDITERKRGEQALRDSRDDLNRAQAVAHTGSWRLDVQHDRLGWSDETYRIFQVPTGTPMTYEAFLATVHPEDRAQVDERWQAALRGEPYDIEHRIIVGEKTVKWVRERAELEFDKQGTLTGGFGTVQDISERKRADQALQESEERFRRVCRAGRVGLYEWNTVRDSAYWSPEAYELFGFDPHTVVNYARWTECLHPDDRQRITGELAGMLEQGRTSPRDRSFRDEYRVVHADGTVLWLEAVTGFALDGEELVIRGAVRDLTERKRAEEALHRLNETLEQQVAERTAALQAAHQKLVEQSRVLDAFFQHTLTPLAILDREFTFLRVNEAYARTGARKVEEFPGHNRFEFYPSDAQTIFEEVVRNRQPYQVSARPFTYPDHPEWGVTYWNWSLTPLLDEQGEVELLVYSLEDVSTRKQAEIELERHRDHLEELVRERTRKLEAANKRLVAEIRKRKMSEQELRASEERFTRVFQLSPVPLATSRLQDGCIENVNGAILAQFGYRQEEVIGKTPLELDLYAHPADREEIICLLKNKGEVREREVDLRTKSGAIRQAVLSIILIEGGGTTFMLVTVQDITERKQAEKALKALNETLERQVAERTAVAERRARQLQALTLQLTEAEERERRRVSDLLHDDLQQVLAATRFNLSKVMRNLEGGSDPHRIVSRVDELLAQSIEKSRCLSQDLSPAILHHSGLSTTTIEWLIRRKKERYGLSVEVDARQWQRMEYDARSVFLFRSIQEMLFNVAKHSGVTQAHLRLVRWADYAEVVVTDEGKGFVPQTLEAPEKPGEGFGLLSIRERVNYLGGSLKIDSAPGAGSRLTLSIPLQGLDQSKTGKSTPAVSEPKSST